MTRWLPRLSLLVAALVLASCTGGGTSSSSHSGPLTSAERLYGLAPDPHPNVTYEPNVVVVGGGANTVRSATADGLTWTLDPGARHVGDLALGKVMVLTNESTGRIISLDHTSAGVVVTLAPVTLGDVFKDADLSWNIPISADQIGFDVAPEPGGNVTTPEPGSTGLAEPTVGTSAAVSGTPVRLLAARRPRKVRTTTTTSTSVTTTTAPPGASSGSTPASTGGTGSGGIGGLGGGFFGEAFGSYPGATGFAQDKKCGDPTSPVVPLPKIRSTSPFEATPGLTLSPGIEVGRGNWVFESERAPGQLTFRVAYNKGVRLGLVFRVHGNLSFSGSDTIRGGKETPNGLRLNGIDGITVGFLGGSASAQDNIRARIDIPINLEILTQQFYIDGIPFVVAAKPKIILETAFGANYSTLWTCGDYKLTLDQRIDNAGPVADFFRATKSLLPISGVSIGVNAVVAAAEIKFTLGFGIRIAYAGPFVTFGVAVGATRGSDIGIVHCQSADLVVTGKAGAGFSIDSNLSRYFNASITNSLRGAAAGKYRGIQYDLLGLSRAVKEGQSVDFDHTLYARNIYGPVHKTIPQGVPLCGS